MTGAMWTVLAVAVVCLVLGFGGQSAARKKTAAALDRHSEAESLRAIKDTTAANTVIGIGVFAVLAFVILFVIREVASWL